MSHPRRRWLLIAAAVAIALVAGVGGILAFRESPFEFDTEWMDEVLEERNVLLTVPSLVMDFLGGGWFAIFVVPLGLTAVLLILRRPLDALYFILATAISAGLVQLLKFLVGRDRPTDILVHVDPGSFPSGHTANAATLAVALGLILARTWVWVAGIVYVVLMALSRTYLGAHWVSDTIGGAVLGAGVAVLLWTLFRARLARSRSSEPA